MTDAEPARAEIETYARELRVLLDQIVVSLRGLTVAQLDWRPATGTANSARAIATHVCAATRVYTLGFGCGLAVERDREREFAASGHDLDALIAQVTRLSDDVQAALAALEPAALAERFTPPRELWGTGELHEISRRDALVESIRHAGLHLGELRLTRDLAVRDA